MTNTGRPGDGESTEPDSAATDSTAQESTAQESAAQPSAESTSAEDTNPRLSIPPNLWDTGLFKPAWTRPSSSSTSDAPPRSRSLLSRPEDLDAQPEPETEAEPEAEAEPASEAAPETGIDPDLVVPPALAGFATGTHPAVAAAEPEPAAAEEPVAGAGPDAAPEPVDESVTEPVDGPEDEAPTEASAVALSPIAAAAAAAAASHPAPTEEPEQPEQPEALEEPEQPEATQLVPTQPGAPDETQVAPRVIAPRTEEDPAQATQVAATAAATAVVPALTPTTAPETTTTVAPVEEPPARRGKGLAIVLSIVVVIALIGGGWFLWQRSQDGPVREAFGDSHGAFVSASSRLTTAESLDDVAAAGAGFAEATELLEETRSTVGGRTSSLATSVRRAVAAELEVSEAAQQLAGLAEGGFEDWGAARGDLKSGLEALEGVHDDIVAAGGSVEDLPSSDVVTETDRMVAQAARRVAGSRTSRATTDLASAELLADLRGIGRRSGSGATLVTGAVDSLGGSDVDTADLEAKRDVLDALGRLTRLKPATLNEWEAIRTRVERAAEGLADEEAAALTAALAQADTMVTEAAEAWETWQSESEGARTAQAEDLEAVKDARTELDAVLQELESLDGDLAAYLSSGAAGEGGPESGVRTTLVEAADARDGLRTRVYGLAMPVELAEETSAIDSAMATHAATVRGAADAAATCVAGCQVPDTTAWQTLVAQRDAQVTAIRDAVQAWRDAAQDALKEIRQRELPEKPEI